MFSTLVVSLLFLKPVLCSYVPQPAACPSESLVRPAIGLSDDEETYRVARKGVADENLRAWLEKTSADFGTGGELPTVRISPLMFQ